MSLNFQAFQKQKFDISMEDPYSVSFILKITWENVQMNRTQEFASTNSWIQMKFCRTLQYVYIKGIKS